MRTLLIGCFVIPLLVLAAGCGGSSPSPTEQWAGDFCSSVDDWATKLQGYANDVQSAVTSPSADSVPSIQAAITNGTQATNQLVTDLKGLGPPPNNSQATGQVESLKTQLQQSADKVESQAQALQSSATPTQLATSIGAIATEVSAALAQGKSTFESLKNSSSELKDAISNDDSCQQLQNDFG
jgi:hypothetical protein